MPKFVMLAGSSRNFYHENFLQRLQMRKSKRHGSTWAKQRGTLCWCQTSLEAMEGQGGHEGFTFKLHCWSRSLGLRRAPQMEIDGSRDHRIPQNHETKNTGYLWVPMKLWDVYKCHSYPLIIVTFRKYISHTSRNQRCFHWFHFCPKSLTSIHWVFSSLRVNGKRGWMQMVIAPIGKGCQGNHRKIYCLLDDHPQDTYCWHPLTMAFLHCRKSCQLLERRLRSAPAWGAFWIAEEHRKMQQSFCGKLS